MEWRRFVTYLWNDPRTQYFINTLNFIQYLVNIWRRGAASQSMFN